MLALLSTFRDILCGLLHCAGGNPEPLFHGADKGFSKTTITITKKVAFECKSVHGPAMMDMPHMGLVQDGTRCKEQHVCRNNRCVPLPFVPVLSCPGSNATTICSGNGVSENTFTVQCFDGGATLFALLLLPPRPNTLEIVEMYYIAAHSVQGFRCS
jgi:hypothetical protein